MLPDELTRLIQTDPYAMALHTQWLKHGEDFRRADVVLDFAVKLCVVLSEKAREANDAAVDIINRYPCPRAVPRF